MFTFGYFLGIAVDVAVLFFVAGTMNIPNNTITKAIMVTAIAVALGFLAAPVLIAFAFSGFIAGVFAIVIAGLFFRLFAIKFFYGVSFGKAFSVWIMTAVVSILVNLLLPF